MVRGSIAKSEEQVRFYKRLTAREFDQLDYEDIVFCAKILADKKAEESRERMTAASFTAWQIMRVNGYKKSWTAHLKVVGLTKEKPKRTKIDKDEKKKAVFDALQIAQRLKRNGKS
jgi:hypothetical protein